MGRGWAADWQQVESMRPCAPILVRSGFVTDAGKFVGATADAVTVETQRGQTAYHGLEWRKRVMDDETRERFERIEANLQAASERIDMLTKIHLDNQRDHEERIAALEKTAEETRAAVREMRATNHQMALYTLKLDELLENFVETFRNHDNRLDDHKRRLDDLEGGRN
jgi:hypothetical protein